MLDLKFNPDMYGIKEDSYVPDPEKEMGLASRTDIRKIAV